MTIEPLPPHAEGGTNVVGSSNELTNRLERWIRNQGYPLEMRVARAVRLSGLTAHRGFHYYDEQSEVFREVDVLAAAGTDRQVSEVNVLVRAVFETKSSPSKSKPRVILAYDQDEPDLHPRARAAQRYITDRHMDWWVETASRDERIQDLAALKTDGVRGYSLIQGSLSDRDRRDDPAFAALMQVAKASDGICKWSSASGQRGDDSRRYELFALVLPVIVIDSPPFSCSLDQRGELQLAEVKSGTVRWSNRVSMRRTPMTIIKVLREEALPAFLADIRTAAATIERGFDRTWK